MITKKTCLLIIVLCQTLASAVLAEPSNEALVDKIVANVDNQIVLQSELETAYQQYLAQGGKEEPTLKCKILEHLVLNKMLLAKAKAKGVVIEQEEIEQEVDRRIRYITAQAGSVEAVEKYFHKSLAEISNDLRERMREQLTLERMRAQVIKDVTATPQEVKNFFEALPAHERHYYPASVTVRHIVKYPAISQYEVDSLTEQLKALKTRLQGGETFEALARQYSQDPGSSPQGGMLGFFRLGELAPAYEAAALALKPGELSEPVITEFGFHLIKLIASICSDWK